MFNSRSRSGVDENSTPDNMFDITLKGTKNWQGGLNAKEPVCPAAFVYFFMVLHVYALRCIALPFTTVVCCSQSQSRCVSMSCSQSCAFTSSFWTNQTTARPTMHVSAAVSMQYIYSSSAVCASSRHSLVVKFPVRLLHCSNDSDAFP